MGVSKVILNGTTLIDVTQDTVTPDSMLDGVTALAKNGERATGTITGTGSATTGISIADHATTTMYGVTSSTTTATKVTLGSEISVPNVTSVGSGDMSATVASHTLSFSHTHTAPTLGSAISVPNVTNVADVTVPIKDTNSTTVVTGKTHTVTDNGHTHTIGS